MKRHFIFFIVLYLFITNYSLAQVCSLSGTQTLNSNQINNTCNGSTEIVIEDGAVIGINGSWVLDANIQILRIKGTGSITFGNADDIVIDIAASIIIENTSNVDALKITATNPSKIRIDIGGTGTNVYTEGDFPAIIANGGINQGGFLLAVELSSFKANLKGETIILNWETLSEMDNLGFEIQKSGDLKNWDRLGFIEGQLSSSIPISYTYEDKAPLVGLNYYRLKIYDVDHEFEYSNVINVAYKPKNSLINFVMYPNPTSGVTKITTKKEEEMTMEIINLQGQIIQSNNFKKEIIFDTNNLNTGLYFIKIVGQKSSVTRKLIVQ